METENFDSDKFLWNDFLKENPTNKIKKVPISFYFCDNEKDANECAELVVKGIKKQQLLLCGGMKRIKKFYQTWEINN